MSRGFWFGPIKILGRLIFVEQRVQYKEHVLEVLQSYWVTSIDLPLL